MVSGITLFTLIHDPHKRKTGHYCLHHVFYMHVHFMQETWLRQMKSSCHAWQWLLQLGLKSSRNMEIIMKKLWSLIWWPVLGISQLFLGYFSVVSHLFCGNFLAISCFSVISHLFPRNFLVISHFLIISQPFLDYFSIIYDIAHVIIFVCPRVS